MPEAAAVTPADLPVSRWRRGTDTGRLPSRREGERERWSEGGIGRDGVREVWREG